MKKFVKKVWESVKSLYDSLMLRTKRYVPVAINVVEGIKKVMDSPVDDVILAIVEAAIPGDADKALIKRVKTVVEKWVPKILLELKLVDSIANMDNINDQLIAVLAQLKLSSDETKSIVYHGLASLIIEKLSDGKISWSDSVAISEYYFTNFVNNKSK